MAFNSEHILAVGRITHKVHDLEAENAIIRYSSDHISKQVDRLSEMDARRPVEFSEMLDKLEQSIGKVVGHCVFSVCECRATHAPEVDEQEPAVMMLAPRNAPCSEPIHQRTGNGSGSDSSIILRRGLFCYLVPLFCSCVPCSGSSNAQGEFQPLHRESSKVRASG
jgi:hypothetical protein